MHEQLAPLFDREHQKFNPHVLYNLELGEAYCRNSFLYPDPNPQTYPDAENARRQSRRHYGRPRPDRRARGRSASFAARTYDRCRPSASPSATWRSLQAIARYRFLTADLAASRRRWLSTRCRQSAAAPCGACLSRARHDRCDRAVRIWSRQQGARGFWPGVARISITASIGPRRMTRRIIFSLIRSRSPRRCCTLRSPRTMSAIRLIDHHELVAGHAGADAASTRSVLHEGQRSPRRRKHFAPCGARSVVLARVCRRHAPPLRARARPRHHGHLGQPTRRQVELP